MGAFYSQSVRQSQRGYSLVEVLVAVALIGAIAMVATQFTNMYLPNQTSLQRACQTHAQSVVGLVESETYYRQILTFTPLGAARSATTFSPSPGFTNSLVPDATLWSLPAANYLINTSAGSTGAKGVYLQNFQLIQGSMRDLATIYNTTPAVQCAYGAYPTLTASAALTVPATLAAAILAPPAAGNGVFISITPFSRSTGATLCGGAASFNPLPEPASLASNAFNPGSGFLPNAGQPPALNQNWAAGGLATPAGTTVATLAAASAASSDIAFELSARIQYSENNANRTCNFTQKFEYPPDRAPPPPPTIAITANPTNPTPTDCAAFAPTQPITMTVGYSPAANFEPGSQLICLDQSYTMAWTADPAMPATQAAGPPCVTSGGVADPFVYDSHSTFVVNPLSPGYQPSSRVFTGRLPTPSQWVPCDQLVQCGAAPTTVVYSQATQANVAINNQTFTMTYALPTGCVVNFAAVAVDTAGNKSTTAYAHPGPANTLLALEYVSPNTCGVYCPAQANWTPAQLVSFPLGTGGYYTCMRYPTPSCCIGATCLSYLN